MVTESEFIFADEATMQSEDSETRLLLKRNNPQRPTVHDATSNGIAGDGHSFQPSQYGTIDSSIQRVESVNDDPLCHSVSSCVPILHVYRRRWWILLVYSLFAFMQGGLGNVWTVIAGSAEAVFGWTDKEVSLMQMWLYVTYLVSMFPFAWLIDQKGWKLLFCTVFRFYLFKWKTEFLCHGVVSCNN